MIDVLMIEDDPELASIITRYLKKFEIKVKNVEEPYKGIEMLREGEYQLLILDLTLPEIDGLEVVSKIREFSSIPIIISSARDDITDKVIGLERGADDYMPKPYDPRELVTRIKTILRRTSVQQTDSVTEDVIFDVDIKGRVILFRGRPLDLTAAEFDVLSMLVQHKNGSVSREQLLYESEHIDDESSIKNIDVIISRIRHKIAEIDSDHIYIKPVRGVGYLLTDRI